MSRGEKFSNEKYLTKQQVAREMGSTLIESIWNEVLAYRQNFMTQLTLRTVEKDRLRVVQTPKISDKVNTVERRFTKVLYSLSELQQLTDQIENFELALLEKVLNSVAHKYDVELSTTFVYNLYHGNVSAPSPRELIFINYYEALKKVKEAKNRPLDENLLIEIGEYFNDLTMRTYVYRQTEYKDPQQTALIGRVFIHVPVNQVSDMITDLLGFMQVSSAPLFVKFSALLFFTNYIKPFELYSEEIAILLAKSFLVQNDLESFAHLLDFERLLGQNREEADEVMLEVKRTSDLTYFIDFLTRVADEMLDEVEKLIGKLKVVKIVQERHDVSTSEAPKVQNESGQISLFDTDVEPEVTPTPKRDVREIIGYKEQPTVKTEVPVVEPVVPVVSRTAANIAIGELPVVLSESEAKLLERHLLESDPSLSRSEATFYARHCTLGKYYTIANFREYIGCAYETARTSMDHLANAGYYDKQKLKNKFIYTPVERK